MHQLENILEDTPNENRNLYQRYSLEEEIERVAYHYEVEPAFFQTVTGGEWNTYSCNIWKPGYSLTQAQEEKLDKFAELMQLRPGMKILDVGCGWGGPLVYLCHKYGVHGHGITISPKAIPIAEARAEKYQADAKFEVIHWQNLPEAEAYDAILTDEVIVHFNNLNSFFAKCHKVLKPGSRMVHKELHFNHSRHKHALDALSQHINKVYGYTGNYRTLYDELELMDFNGFALKEIVDIPIVHYKKTIADYWLKACNDNRAALEAMTNEKHVKDFRIYLKGILKIFNADVFGLHMVTAQKI